jgi:hypothetical protein
LDDIFALKHEKILINEPKNKKIIISSFNTFKKALTYDDICDKIYRYREKIMVLIDEVDDFLERDKLVFNIC